MASFAALSWNNYVMKEKDIIKISKITTRFINDVKSKKLHSPTLINIIPYNIMRGMGQHYTLKSEYPTEDGNWWTDETRSRCTYFPEVKMPLYKRAFGYLFYQLGKKLGGKKSMLVTYKK